MDVQLFNETTSDLPPGPGQVHAIARQIQHGESCSFAMLEVVYVDEGEIVRINTEHLDRSYVTDVITFRYDDHEDNNDIEGTVFCCAPRIEEQAGEYGQELRTEFARVLIHGLLHLTGYEDQSAAAKEEMTARENHYLQLISDS